MAKISNHILFFSFTLVLVFAVKYHQKATWSGCLSHHEVIPLMKYRKSVEKTPMTLTVSLDLGISSSAIVLNAEGLIKEGSLLATWDELNEVKLKAEKGQPGCYALYDDGCKPWRVSCISPTTGNPASLCPPLEKSGAPTMVLGGFTMHRIAGEGIDPMVDTQGKITGLGLAAGHSVLDTCMGLGYTAIEAARRVHTPTDMKSGHVTTIEYDDASVDMALHNPWSKQLFDESLPIEILRGDSCELIKNFPTGSFNAVLHDPPARALCRTGMYSTDFYCQLRRVLKDGGRLYHYIGNPESKESGTLYAGIINRLQQAGFSIPKHYQQAFGVLAEAKGCLPATSPNQVMKKTLFRRPQ